MQEAPLFSVPLADLDYGEREIDEEIPAPWLSRALAGTEAVPRDKPGRLTVTVSKNGREVMVRGRARAYVTMPCARTLDPVAYDLSPDIFLLLGPPTEASRQAPRIPSKKPVSTAADGVKGNPKKAAAPARKAGCAADRKRREEDTVLAEEEAARDTYEVDRVTLDPFLREFFLLELPMVPLREDLRSEATPAIERPLEPAPEEGQPAHEARIDGVGTVGH